MFVDFLNGKPSEELLPAHLFAQAAQKAFTRTNAAQDILQYGNEHGNPEFLNNLATFLSKEYQSPVSSRHLCATPGASLSLEHILSLLTRPGFTHVFFQDPTYFLVFDTYLNLGYTRDEFIGIPEEEDGINLDILETHLAHLPKRSQSACFDAVLYCVPTHANPTGSILSAEKRKRLVELGRKFNMLIICDDVYDILTYEGQVPKRIVAYDLEEEDAKHVVISNGSFSKLLAPGARAGWIETSEEIIRALADRGSFVSGGSPSHLSCGIVNEMLSDGSLYDNTELLKKTFADRLYRGIWQPIQGHLVPLGCSVNIRPKGGYFVWMKIPVKASYLTEVIKRNNLEVGLGLGTQFVVSVDSSDADYYIRLSFAHYDTHTLQLGIFRLKEALILALK